MRRHARSAVATSSAGELILAGFAWYSSGSAMAAPAGWSLDPDDGYFSAVEFVVGGVASSSYGGTGMGTITSGMTAPANGTCTILALKAR
jgi:hypothetical protein